MTNTEVIEKELGKKDRRCIWQISPDEMPKDMADRAIELWQDIEGRFHVFVMVCSYPVPGDTWFRDIDYYLHMKQ